MLLRELSSRLNRAFLEPIPAKAPTHEYVAPPPAEAQSEDPDPRSILSSIGELVYDWNILTDKLNWGPNVAEVLGPIAGEDISTDSPTPNASPPRVWLPGMTLFLAPPPKTMDMAPVTKRSTNWRRTRRKRQNDLGRRLWALVPGSGRTSGACPRRDPHHHRAP